MDFSIMSFKKGLKILSLILIVCIVFSFNVQADEDEGEGEDFEELAELTGNLNYILFGLSALILPWKYIYKSMIKNVEKDSTSRNLLRHFNSFAKKSHLFIGAGAFGVISYHAYITIDKWNILLPVGLALVGLYVLTGVLFYIKFLNSKLRKILYKFHSSLIFLIITIVIMYLGHILTD